MRRAGGLFEPICSWDNLLLAARRARAGKRYRPDVLAFEFRQEEELLALREELRSGAYRPRPPRHFKIREPKQRWITAAAYRDRVVHHAVCNLVEPVLERGFVHDCWANRRGKGSHRAVLRLQAFCRRFPLAVKLDLVKYFASIDHDLLLARLARRFKEPRLLALLSLIVRSGCNPEAVAWHGPGDDLLSPLGRRTGLPIGNLTSQLLSNEFLCAFDHWVVERLRPGAYLRFVDDMVVLGADGGRLREEVAAMRERLCALRLRLHEERLHLRRVEAGIPFLGYVVRPRRLRVRGQTVRRYRRRVGRLARAVRSGRVAPAAVRQSLAAWRGHVILADPSGGLWLRTRQGLSEREAC